MARAQLIFTDNPGELPADYVLPPDLDLEISSVYARINGAAASGSFRPTLSVLSQSGNLIARVPLDETYAVADTGDATWSPFLRTAQQAAAGGDAVPWCRISRRFADAAQVIATNSFTEIDMTTSYNVGAGESGEGVFTVDLTANEIRVVNAGVVMVRAMANWLSAITNNWIVWVSNSEVANQNQRRSGGGISTTAQDELMFLTRVPANSSFSAGVWQIDGANRSLDVAFLELHYLGTYTGTNFDSMDPDIA
jgi:hypothetical protein